MAAREIVTYAKVDGPPFDWMMMRVFDRDTGQEIREVTEVDAAAGWLERYKTNARGEPVIDPEAQAFVKERITGRFEIRRQP